MTRLRRPLTVYFYRDLLCTWCHVAAARLASVRAEFGDLIDWRVRPFPMKVEEAVPTERELRGWMDGLRRARREPEGKALAGEIWTSNDPPRSSIAPLAAVEAAQLQGQAAADRLAQALGRAGLEQGLNITRSDVVLELASGLGLEMNRFTAAWQSPQTRRLILEEHRLASARGISRVPTLVIGGRWMLSGLKSASEYRQHLLDCLQKLASSPFRARENTLH